MSQPPPLPPPRPPTVDYHQPRAGGPGGIDIDKGEGHGVTGVNLRWKDNLFQLLAGVVGAVVGGIGGLAHGTYFTVPCAVAGMLAGVIAWGGYLAIYHFVRRRRRNGGE